MTKTSNFQLNQWEATDPIRREDFNADNAAIDAALGELNIAVTAGLKIETGSYSGSGVCGNANKNTLTFSFPPKIVGIVVDGTGQLRGGTIFLNGQNQSSGIGGTDSAGGAFYLYLTWSGNSVSWYTEKTSSADNQLNASGYTYRYFAIG